MSSKRLQKKPTAIAVVAAALIAPDGRILMQRRRIGGMHGGLWEFPGGKVEPGESRVFALIRELQEELGVVLLPNALMHLATAGEAAGPIVIDLYTAREWSGEARCLAGEEIAWFAPAELAGLAMPPLDIPLAQALSEALQQAI